MPADLRVSRFIAGWATSPFGGVEEPPWRLTGNAAAIVRAALQGLDRDYRQDGEVAVHRTATVERGAVVKGPAIIGPDCFVATGAYLRGGVYLAASCIVGPGSELKSSFLFHGSKLAHFNFVGDSLLGAAVNVEAGAIVANYRNELADKAIRFRFGASVVETGVDKFGALIGDAVRIGANAVVAPGAALLPGATVLRLSLVDLHPQADPAPHA